jgi:hypothetical protein
VARSQRAWTRIATWGGVLVASAALLGLALVLVRDDKVAGVAGMFLGLAGLAVSVLGLVRRPGTTEGLVRVPDHVRLRRAATKLAEDVHAQWEAEAGLRALYRPAPLRLTWSETTRKVVPPAEDITGGTVTSHLRGHSDEVADKFLALPQRRLVVLGGPGAGKTVLAMLLTLKLLERRQRDEPVPVLLGLSSWNPTKEHLHAWLARRLGEDYPALAHPAYGPAAPQELIRSKRVLPVLDGLDELHEPLRASAISALDQALANRPLVLACRGQEYQQAVAAGGGVVSAAAVVELQPVTVAEAIAFLRRAAAPAPERWDQVAADLHARPDGALAAALSTPLMVALARTVYASPGRDPSELLGLAHAGGQAAVERHLLDAFIPAAYTTSPPAPDAPPPRRRRPPDPELARRWLTLLATHLHWHHTHDLAWWQLPRLVPQRARRRVVGPGAGLLVALVLGLLIGLLGGLLTGLVAGLVLGAAFGAALGVAFAAGPLAPTRVDLRIRRRLRDLRAALEGDRMTFARELGEQVGRAVGRAVSPMIWLLLILAVWFWGGGTTGLWSEFEGTPLLVVVISFGLGLAFWFWITRMVGDLVGGMVGGVLWLMEWLRSPADDARAVTPWSVFRDDRTAAIVLGLVGGLLLGPMGALFMGVGWLVPPWGSGLMSLLKSGLEIGLAVGLVGGLVGGLGFTAWGQFTIVRAWLAVRGKLPWRLMAFLDDAHQRGVLRQAGAVYQFRHARLQNHLADTSPASQTDR